ncbi:hypothetical protein D4764_20G0000010, partial [Takifugu flavidus]
NQPIAPIVQRLNLRSPNGGFARSAAAGERPRGARARTRTGDAATPRQTWGTEPETSSQEAPGGISGRDPLGPRSRDPPGSGGFLQIRTGSFRKFLHS